MITSKVIRSYEELRAYADAWTTLLSHSNQNVVFLTWEWLSTWIEVYLEENQLLVIAIFRDDVLIGLAPLWVRRSTKFGVVSVREVHFLGSREVCSDHLDMILHRDYAGEAAQAIWQELFDPLQREWDVLKLEHTPQDSPMIRLVHQQARDDERCAMYEVVDFSVCPYIILPETYDKLVMSIGSKTRYNISKSERLLEKQGAVTFDTCATEEELDALYPWLVETHKKNWARRGKFGSYALPRFSEFHRRISRLFLKNGWLCLSALRIDGVPIASTYSFNYGGIISGYLAAVDFEYDRRLSVGRILLARSLEQAVASKSCIFDMLRGEESYKYHWTARDRRNVSVVLYNRTLRGLFMLTLSANRNFARALFRTFVRKRHQSIPESGAKNSSIESQPD